jgi:mannose/fructose/N-acetylgalactosamine-specific phosphotransferase system component IIB
MTRIDDRLIHGQVLIGCAEVLGAERLLLINDAAAADDMMRRIYTGCVPAGVAAHVASVDDSIGLLTSWSEDECPTIVVMGSAADLLALRERGARLDNCCLGGAHYAEPDAVELVSGVFVSPSELAALRSLVRQGEILQVQSVPGALCADLEALLEAIPEAPA